MFIRLSQIKHWVFLLSPNQKTNVVCQKGLISRESSSCETSEWEHSTNSTRLENLRYHVKSSAALEVVPGFTILTK